MGDRVPGKRVRLRGFRLSYTEHLPGEKGATVAASCQWARRIFTLHGIDRIHRVVTDNGSRYRSAELTCRLEVSRHQRINRYIPRQVRQSRTLQSYPWRVTALPQTVRIRS